MTQWLKKKNLPANEGDAGLIPGWEDTLEKGMATHFSVLTGKSHALKPL